MPYWNHLKLLFLCSLFLLHHCLHLNKTQSTQLQQLKAQQSLIGSQVDKILRQTQDIHSQLQRTQTQTDRVQILQQAIQKQKQSIFVLKNQIIYPFNQSQTACKQLTENQKQRIQAQLQQTRQRLLELKAINDQFDHHGVKSVRYVGENINKELILLEQIEEILKIKCKENLSPTIFQSNLNASNWVLGPQTMDDLDEQYAERAFIYHTITNCPLQTPFYSPEVEQCIQCQQPTPLFNMYTKKCTQCALDQELDLQKRICRHKPHYTDFNSVSNWNLDGGQLPQVDSSLTPCPQQKPYWNGVICTKCQSPFYWSVSANSCKQCQKGFAFDMNNKKCEKILKNQLSILQNTHWVAENLTQIIQERIQVLQINKTTGNYHYCPSAMNPFYDGVVCIFCKIFDMDKKKCVQAPEGLVYDDNMKKFILPQSIKETNPTATRYISKNKLPEISLLSCNSSYPFYDGIACIQCVKPFDIFNIDQKRCVSCNADEIFNQDLHICETRKKLHISQNLNRLLATQRVSIQDYKNSLIQTINNNPESIIYPCPSKKDYSNLTHCYPCKDNEYFNVQTYKCVICDGTYIQSNSTCKEKVYIFTNLKAGRIINMGDKTVEGENQRIGKFLQNHTTSYVCPLDKPYAIEGQACGTCPDLFNYETLKCTSCKQFQIYVPDQKACLQAKMLVNFTDPHRILVSQTETLSSFQSQQEKVRSQYPKLAKVCPEEKPYTQNRQYCFSCSSQSPYFNYTIKQCQNCPQHYVFDQQSVRCVQQFFITLINTETKKKMLGYDNYTLPMYENQLQQLKATHPYQLCTKEQPYGTVTGCTQCYEPTPYFDIRKKACSNAKYLINFEYISTDYILPSNKNLDSYISQEQKYRREANQLTIKCPQQKPYTNDRTYCFACDLGQHYNFQTKQCEFCPQTKAYVVEIKSCQDLFYITHFTPVTQDKMKGYNNYTLEDYKRQQNQIKSNNPYEECPDDRPYGTVNGCKQCQEPTPYFDIRRRVCSSAKKLINFNGVSDKFLLATGKTLAEYQDMQQNFKQYSQSLTVQCPVQTPYTQDRNFCFVCKDPQPLFNFQTKKCQACNRDQQYIPSKNKCEKIFYLTNINTQSQKQMLSGQDYTINDFKTDQAKLKEENPTEQCSMQNPFGTNEGCRKCLAPEDYFDIKNRVCTGVRKLINFPAVKDRLVMREGRSIEDYKNQEQDYAQNIKQPTIYCPESTPYTSDHMRCFACSEPKSIFNLQTKSCMECGQGRVYDKENLRCIQKTFYSLLNSQTESKIIETDNYPLEQYKKDQDLVSKSTGSERCPPQNPYAADSGCIRCNSSNPYFNIDKKACTSCPNDQQYYEDVHKCLFSVYLTDFGNENIKITSALGIEEARKLEQQRANSTGNRGIQCRQPKPFATSKGCIACQQPQKPYFNIQTRQCQGCIEFYQYFEDNQCKDNVILMNTKEMSGYIQVDNYTKYNIEKFNNFTYLDAYPHVVDCPVETPFYDDVKCLSCPDDRPIFNLKEKKCVYIDILTMTNVAAMKYYIEQGEETLAALERQIDRLNDRVNIQYCPVDKPYLAGSQCISCPENKKYFNLALQICQNCGPNDNCFDK